jgi:hypothetical protein
MGQDASQIPRLIVYLWPPIPLLTVSGSRLLYADSAKSISDGRPVVLSSAAQELRGIIVECSGIGCGAVPGGCGGKIGRKVKVTRLSAASTMPSGPLKTTPSDTLLPSAPIIEARLSGKSSRASKTKFSTLALWLQRRLESADIRARGSGW